MAVTIRNQRDFAVGAAYIATGAAFAVVSWGYELGSASAMGPGYFPFWLGIVLALLGLVLCAGATSAKTQRLPLQRWDWRTLAWMTGSVAAFGLALRPLGLVLSVFGLVVASSLASREFTWRGTLLNAVVLVLLNTVLFVLLLDLPLPLWPA